MSWATYYGGKGIERGLGITISEDGDILFTGRTFSDNFDISFGNIQISDTSDADVCVIKFDNIGNRKWATCYGGLGEDWGYDVELDQDEMESHYA